MGILIAGFGIGAIFAIDYTRHRTSGEYRALKEVEKLKKEYAEDPYGGDTPEETLRLFIDALKKGDTDLATRFFVIDKQDEWKEDLAKIKDKGLLDEMVKDLGTAKRGKDISGTNTIFSAVNKENEVIAMINIVKAQNNKWKIQDL